MAEVRVSRDYAFSDMYFTVLPQRIVPRMQNCCLMRRAASLDLN